MIQGSSVEQDVIAQVRSAILDGERVLVCLDSNHTREHVLAELEAYGPLVTPDSYCVVFDTIIEQMPDSLYVSRDWRKGNSPMNAVDQFLLRLKQEYVTAADGHRLAFEIDNRIDSKLLISVAPRGYLRRAKWNE
jgi:cephalosporin hydroxylase